MNYTFSLYHADTLGDASNCLYPHKAEIRDAPSFIAAVSHDYVAAQYKAGYRKNSNFIKSNCLMMDCDNDSTENAEEWITPHILADALPDVAFAVHYSRNHMKEKGGRAARPKFHVFFPIPETEDATVYRDLKKQLQDKISFFDTNALDAARFFFGTQSPQIEFFDGKITIVDFLASLPEEWSKRQPGRTIPEGKRNTTLSRFAAQVLKRLGDTSDAYQAFLTESAKCAPPLEEKELDSIWKSALRFYEEIKQQEGYIPPEKYNANVGKGNSPSNAAAACPFNYKPEDYTDVGQAKMLACEYSSELRYSSATDFIYYNGTHWEESSSKARSLAQNLTQKQLDEAKAESVAAWTEMEENGAAEIIVSSKKKGEFSNEQMESYLRYKAAEEYKNFAIGRRKSLNISSTLKEAGPILEIKYEVLDANSYLLCTPDGTYDLQKGLKGWSENRSENYITKSTSLSPGDKGADLWEKQLNLLFCGDQDLIRYVQLVAGAACVGKVFMEQIVIAYGYGANGKSTFWNTLSRILGGYSGKLSSEVLTVRSRTNIKNEMAELKGKRLVIAAELTGGTRLDTAAIKKLCSTDEIYAEKKYKDPFSFVPSHTLVLYTNHLPKINDCDDGTWRRIIVVPFNAKITGNTDIRNYADYLYENAGPAILAWMIEGAYQVIQKNFKIEQPKAVRDAIAKYHDESDWLKNFIAESLDVGEEYTSSSGSIFQAYRSYCDRTGEFARNSVAFYNALDQAGFERERVKGKRLIYGLKLKDNMPESSKQTFPDLFESFDE